MPSPLDRDRLDSLSALREAFTLPEDLVYLNGNSLGALPRQTAARLEQEVRQHWGESLVSAWNTAGWIDLPLALGNKLSGLLGAAADQTLVCDSTSVNLYKLLHVALQRHPQRRILLLEHDAFPTDNYIAQGLLDQHGDLEVRYCGPEELQEQLGNPDVAAALLGHVNYRTGKRLDLAALQGAARAHDIPVVWDLAHSVGALPLALDAWGVEYAVGCSYKFLNGGPGAPAFAYVAKSLQDQLNSPLQGWLGHRQPFAFAADYQPADGIRRLQVGTPAILSMAALDAAIEIFSRVTLDALWQKSCELFEIFAAGIDADPALACFEVLTPRQAELRGSQISLRHPDAHAICRALAAERVIADYREPGILRFGLTPLYTRFADIQQALDRLSQIMRDDRWQAPAYQQRHKVT